jgi:predicted dehydrogenase
MAMARSSAGELRLGIVGAGRIAQVAHLPAATKADRVRLVAICDPSPLLAHGVAQRYDVPGYTDLERLLASGVDAVVVATPDRTHLPLAERALRAGKHVLVEKPLADTVANAERLARIAAGSGCKLQVGAMKRHDPGIEYAKLALQRIGRVASAQAWYRVMSALRRPIERTVFPATLVDEQVRQVEAGFKADRERYLLRTHGAHLFDGLSLLAGELTSLRADVARVEDDFSWHGTGRLHRSDGLVSFEISANVHAEWSEGLDLYGEAGHIRVRSHFPFFRRASDVAVFTEHDCVTVRPSFGDTDPYERQLEAFARAVLDDQPTAPDAEAGVAALRLIEAVQDSTAHAGKEVAL